MFLNRPLPKPQKLLKFFKSRPETGRKRGVGLRPTAPRLFLNRGFQKRSNQKNFSFNKNFYLLAGLWCADLCAVTSTWGGYVRLDTMFDTRQPVESDDSVFALYPEAPWCDSNGADINAHASFGLTPSLTQLCLTITTSKIHGCELGGYIETDFSGVFGAEGSNASTVGLMEVRQAYVQAAWHKTGVLIGQAYHPVYVDNCSPNTVGFYGGLPIASYARNPQIRIEHHWHELTVGLSWCSQFLFFSPGPIGWSRSYIRHALAPELCLICAWERKKRAVAGLLFDVKRLQPAIYVSPLNDITQKYVTEQRLTSMLGSVWFGFKVNNLRINNQVIISQNGADFNTISGYAVSTYNNVTGACTYTNTTAIGAWTDFEYQKYKRLTPGLFLGYIKNSGANKSVYLDPITGKPTYYGFNEELDAVLRCASRITTEFNNFFIGFEVDYSRAWFGPMNRCGKHPFTAPVDSMRFLLVTEYRF